MSKTNVILRVISQNREERMRVKLDAKGFPYIVVSDRRFTITTSEFPADLNCWGDCWGRIEECTEWLDELRAILANPDLTTDQLPMRNVTSITT